MNNTIVKEPHQAPNSFTRNRRASGNLARDPRKPSLRLRSSYQQCSPSTVVHFESSWQERARPFHCRTLSSFILNSWPPHLPTEWVAADSTRSPDIGKRAGPHTRSVQNRLIHGQETSHLLWLTHGFIESDSQCLVLVYETMRPADRVQLNAGQKLLLTDCCLVVATRA